MSAGGHRVRRVLRNPQWKQKEMGGEDEQCGSAGKEVSKPVEIG